MTQISTRWIAGIAAGVVAAAGLFSMNSANADSSASTDTARVGEKAPMFELPDLEGENVAIESFIEDGKIVVLEWWNPGCPFVVKHYEKMSTMSDLAEKYADDVVWIKINSTNPSHPDHGKDQDAMAKWGVEDHTVLLDEDGVVGGMYQAAKTPHMFIIDTEGVLRYNGAIDSNNSPRPYSEEQMKSVTNYVDQALEQIIAGETVTRSETKPYGCSVKYAR